MEYVLTRTLTNMKLVKKENGVYYVRCTAVNKGQSVFRLSAFNDIVYVSRKVELLSGPNEISMQKAELDKLELGKWTNKVPIWSFLSKVYTGGRRYDK